MIDVDNTSEPSKDGQDDPEPSSRTGKPAVQTSSSFLGRLFNWTSQPSPEPGGEDGEGNQLGPAFRNGAPAERAMVMNILRLRDLRVEDVMTPRADIEAVPEDMSLDDVLAAFERGSFSRLPVFRETLDDPIGFVHLKDLAMNYGFDRACEGAEFRLADHIRTALFVPPSMRIAALLQKMQGERVHMALVIDEFGGVDGLITIEDLVEQIVGDIEDEHDIDEVEEWSREGDGVYLISARADIREFEAAEGVTLLPDDWDEDVDTLGGLVFMQANRVPARGEVIIRPEGHEFEIVDADPRRIKRIRLTLSGAAGRGPAGFSQAAE
ncbi:MAG: hemolysin family protein [Pseudomonadota bacterium]